MLRVHAQALPAPPADDFLRPVPLEFHEHPGHRHLLPQQLHHGPELPVGPANPDVARVPLPIRDRLGGDALQQVRALRLTHGRHAGGLWLRVPHQRSLHPPGQQAIPALQLVNAPLLVLLLGHDPVVPRVDAHGMAADGLHPGIRGREVHIRVGHTAARAQIQGRPPLGRGHPLVPHEHGPAIGVGPVPQPALLPGRADLGPVLGCRPLHPGRRVNPELWPGHFPVEPLQGGILRRT